MRVAIAGAGNVGTAIARDLGSNGHDVLLLEKDPANRPGTAAEIIGPLAAIALHQAQVRKTASIRGR